MTTEISKTSPKITEPMTMITDYLIGLELIIFIILIQPSFSELTSLYFSLLFLATAVGAITGGTSHGFTEYLGEKGHRITWTMTAHAIGVGTMFFELALVNEFGSGSIRIVLFSLILIQLLAYELWIISRDEIKFLYVIINYAVTMLICLLYLVYQYFQSDENFVRYLILGIIIGFVAAGIQQSGFKLHTHFNHNDIYHVVQMIGLYFFYLAAREL